MLLYDKFKSIHLTITNHKFKRTSFVKIKYFLFSKIKNNFVQTTLQEIKNSQNKYIIKINNFPYIMPKKTKHYVFWYDQDYTYTMEQALEISTKYFNQRSNIIIFENSYENKSIKHINHYHLIIHNS